MTAPTLTAAQTEAIHWLGVYTAGRFRFYTLAGSIGASCRSHILSVLFGRKVAQKDAGITALREAFAAFLTPGADLCRAAAEDELVRLCRESGAYKPKRAQS